ncbi:MAG: GNAT family N-acetyltransferase [Bacteroidetes bacterium]|nr:GNAT family N-acetyltransferase [Bacteroidota bacterium]
MIKQIKEKSILEGFFRRNTALNIYQLGDLDEFYWHQTDFFGYFESDELKSVVMLYKEVSPNVLIALSVPDEIDFLKKALINLLDVLPEKLYLHITPGAEDALMQKYNLHLEGLYWKMCLNHGEKLIRYNTDNVINFSVKDKIELSGFYSEAYPHNSFNLRMLETGMYFGIRETGKIAAAAGIHVYSPQYKAAALGNITTHPNARGKGYATKVTACLCKELFQNIEVIGLNVHSENLPAIHCYENLGFVKIADYLEITAVCE